MVALLSSEPRAASEKVKLCARPLRLLSNCDSNRKIRDCSQSAFKNEWNASKTIRVTRVRTFYHLLTARVLIIYQVNYAKNNVCLRNLWFLLSINQHFRQLTVENMFFDGSCWLHWDPGTEVFREERFFSVGQSSCPSTSPPFKHNGLSHDQ